MERWPSGLRRTLGKRVKGKLFHGFESHSLRHIRVKNADYFTKFKKKKKKLKNVKKALIINSF